MAGSERVSRTGLALPQSAQHKAAQSFAAFRSVLRALAGDSRIVPWRDSVLTRLLQISLDQRLVNAAMIANFGPAGDDCDETRATLEMAKCVAAATVGHGGAPYDHSSSTRQ